MRRRPTVARCAPATTRARPREPSEGPCHDRDRHRRTRDHRRSADRRTDHHRRVRRLVLPPAVRLPQRVRGPARRRSAAGTSGSTRPASSTRRSRCTTRTPPSWSPGSSREAGVGQVVDFMPPAGIDGHRQPPARPDAAVRPRADDLRGRRRPALRLRPPRRTARRVTEHGVVFTANGSRLDPARRSRARRRAEGAGRGRATRTCTGRSSLVAGEIRGVVLESAADGPPREMPGRRDPGAVRRDGRFLAVVGGSVDLHRPVARGHPAVGDHAQADDLRPDRRPGRRAHRGPARAGRRRAQLGLPLHLGARRLVLRARPPPPGLRRGGRTSSRTGWATGSGSGSAATAAR